MVEVKLLKEGEIMQSKLVADMGVANNQVEKWRRLYGKGFQKLTVEFERDNKRGKEKSHFKKGELAKRVKINSGFAHVKNYFTKGLVKHV